MTPSEDTGWSYHIIALAECKALLAQTLLLFYRAVRYCGQETQLHFQRSTREYEHTLKQYHDKSDRARLVIIIVIIYV